MASITLSHDAVAEVTPAALPAFTRELSWAADSALQGGDFLSLRCFAVQWTVHVHIQRDRETAARYRELEDRAVASGDPDEARGAVAELGRILDAAHAAVAHGEVP
ncbi:hypothetical protein OEIGOIKO_04642 [Streptomyces chrestomyceticus JCM 4735]|uniref:Uncharacterized protein n=1 Tax=Streptomyces chrestomyceticus JCM 4735 TaxID=1306181 RepID=A0A7U9KZK6_9ACTN|nr:hypothetical protein [Streptomyces chrestomyceticus]GCD36861.1 hypothetical protein OEIGOIKO_04642 [Streptomyces chrestomyceticus JCM 4735]